MSAFTKQQYTTKLSTLFSGFLLIVGLLSATCLNGLAQSSSDTTFGEGLELYENARYSEAARIFSQINSAEARLFAGKSFYAAGAYFDAQSYLSSISESAPANIYLESQYTRSLVAFQLKQFDQVVRLLHQTKEHNEIGSTLRKTSEDFYKSVLSYLTVDQQKEVFSSVADPAIRLDLLESIIGRVDYPTMASLFQRLKPYLSDSSQAPLQISHIKSVLSDSAQYARKYENPDDSLTPPEGMSYEIGVALPLFSPDEAEFNVTRGLYNGIILAAEDYNKRNPDRKVFIRHRNTTQKTSRAGAVFNQLIWAYPIDVIIGPLFSESAYRMAELAEQHEVPMITPLANSDTLNLHNPYVFQLNPTFAVRGRKMARFAVRNLGLDTMAVIAQKNALGYESAFAFRDQAERLGAKISHFYVDDFEANGYDLSDFSKYFTADEETREKEDIQKLDVDAIYAPFTGQAASTLIDLLMTDLEAANSDATLLGSAGWGAYDMNDKRIRNFEMYYPESDPLTADSSQYRQFDQSYKNRFGTPPSKFSYIGYDTADLLLKTLNKVGNPSLLRNKLRNNPLYEGLTGPIHFRGEQINQEIEIKKIELEK